jgi:uncharacterized membrane protein YphA (DoxX/SURF4 family)
VTLNGVHLQQGGTVMLDPRLNASWLALRLAYGLVPIVAGLDKFTGLLTRWTDVLSPTVTLVLPVSASTFVHFAGVVEIAAGILVLSPLTRYAAWVVGAWLLLIAANLLTTGHYLDVATRDVVMAVGAFVLARLSAVKVSVEETKTEPGSLRTARTPA